MTVLVKLFFFFFIKYFSWFNVCVYICVRVCACVCIYNLFTSLQSSLALKWDLVRDEASSDSNVNLKSERKEFTEIIPNNIKRWWWTTGSGKLQELHLNGNFPKSNNRFETQEFSTQISLLSNLEVVAFDPVC